jgi:hypothetical protein
MRVTMEITGLCGIVPPAVPGDPLVVVLLSGVDHEGHAHAPHGTHGPANAREGPPHHPAAAAGGPGGQPQPALTCGHSCAAPRRHTPFLAVNMRYAVQDVPDPLEILDPDFIVGLGGGKEIGLWSLSGLEVVPPPGVSARPVASYAGEPGAVIMKNITGNGRIQGRYVQGDLPSAEVSGRVLLSGGTLKYPGSPFDIPWTFCPVLREPPPAQRLTERVAYELEVTEEARIKVVLRHPKAPAGAQQHAVFVSSADLADGGGYTLAISNLPSFREERATANQEVVVAHHFSHFYRLLEEPIEGENLPLPRRPRGPTGGSWGSFCPQALYDAPSRAGSPGGR